ncbi:MAG: hypothetical protein ABSF32_01215 [Ignavibacteria bacterium]
MIHKKSDDISFIIIPHVFTRRIIPETYQQVPDNYSSVVVC